MRGSAIKREPQGAPRPHSHQNRPADAAAAAAAKAKAALTNGVKLEKEEEKDVKDVKVVKEEETESCLMNGVVKKEEMEEREINGCKPYTEETKPYSETTNGTSARAEPVCVTMTTAESNGDAGHKPSSQSENSQPPAEVPPPQPVKRKCRVGVWLNRNIKTSWCEMQSMRADRYAFLNGLFQHMAPSSVFLE